jgi:hypothetical protein
MLQYAVSFSVRDCEDGVCRLLTIYHIIRRQQRRALVHLTGIKPVYVWLQIQLVISIQRINLEQDSGVEPE